MHLWWMCIIALVHNSIMDIFGGRYNLKQRFQTQIISGPLLVLCSCILTVDSTYRNLLKWLMLSFFLFFLCSFWLWTLSFSWATRSWPWVQRSTFLPPSTSTLTSSTFSSTSWLLWDAPANKAAPQRQQEGDRECLPLLWNVANMTFPLLFISSSQLFPSLITHRVVYLF